MNDFDSTYFKGDWNVAYDKLGDGCTIDFPIRGGPPRFLTQMGQ